MSCYDLSSLENFAEDFAGNWRKWDSFCWNNHAMPDAAKWGIHYTHHRDSNLLELANREAMDREMAVYLDADTDTPDAIKEDHGHWAYGWVAGYSIRVYTDDNAITEACSTLYQLLARISEYPILDESLFSEMAVTALNDDWPEIVRDVIRELSDSWYFIHTGQRYNFDFCDVDDTTDLEDLFYSTCSPYDYYDDITRDFDVDRYCRDLTNERIDPDQIVNACFADLESYREHHTGTLFTPVSA